MTLLEFIKRGLRIDHEEMDGFLEALIDASRTNLEIAGVVIDDNNNAQRIAHLHFVRVNYKNGLMTDGKEYEYPEAWRHAVEQARCNNG